MLHSRWPLGYILLNVINKIQRAVPFDSLVSEKVFREQLDKMKEGIPTFELRIIKDSDHWVIAEHPDELFKALEEFLEKIYQ
jgi:pimeloyl-ACP methyl ester carboxylesterase